MVSNYSPLQTLSYAAIPRIFAGGRAYFPVPENQLMYSHFKYVSGVPESKNQNGVNVDKLSILNQIIDQLISMKTTEPKDEVHIKNEAMSDAQIDKLIDYYSKQIKIAAAFTTDFGYGAPVQAAVVLNLTA